MNLSEDEEEILPVYDKFDGFSRINSYNLIDFPSVKVDTKNTQLNKRISFGDVSIAKDLKSQMSIDGVRRKSSKKDFSRYATEESGNKEGSRKNTDKSKYANSTNVCV